MAVSHPEESSPPSSRDQYEEALSRGHSFSWDQRWSEAIQAFEEAIVAAESQPAPYAGLGMAYFELGRLEEALTNYKLAARYSRGDIIYLRHVADVQERLGHLQEAGQTYMAVAEIQLRRKKLDEAVGNWLRAVRLEPNLIAGHQRLATVYRRQGLTRNAIREYLAMARIFHMRGDKDKALEICRVALELDPRNTDVRTAVDLIQQGEQFITDEYNESPTDDAATTNAVHRMATILETQRKDWQANYRKNGTSLLETAQKMAQQQLAQEIFSGDDEESDFQTNRGLSKLEQDALISQALDFQTRGMIDEAISCFERATSGGMVSTAAQFSLGQLYSQKMRFGQAIRVLELAVKDPTYRTGGHFSIGKAYHIRGDLSRAVVNYLAALQIIDLDLLDSEKTSRAQQLYKNLSSDLLVSGELERLDEFATGLSEFLGQSDWSEEVKKLRNKLDSLSANGQTLILGDILTAGSVQVLESLHLSKEYAGDGKFDSAVEEAYRAIQLSPHYLPGHLQLAEIMTKQDRTEIAATKFLTIGDTYHVRGDITGAIGNYERAVGLSSMDLVNRARLIDLLVEYQLIDRALDHYMIMAEAHYNLAEVEKARETYLQALKLVPKSEKESEWRLRLLHSIADIDMQRLDWKRALAAYNELQASEPENETYTLNLIDLYYKVGQPSEALRKLDQFLIRLARSGQGGRLTQILESLVEERPITPDLVQRLSRLYSQQGRRSDAVKLLDRLGEAQLNAGENRQAISTIEGILQLHPPNESSYRQLINHLRQELD